MVQESDTDHEAIIAQVLQTGASTKVSDAFTINRLPGPLYIFSSKAKACKLRPIQITV
jgi:hypothetical protein